MAKKPWRLVIGVLGLVAACSEPASAPDGAIDSVIGGDAAVVEASIDATADISLGDGTNGRGGKKGLWSEKITVEGVSRLYAVYSPKTAVRHPMPLVLHFHGWRPLPAEVESEVQYVYSTVAEKEGFVAVAFEALPCPGLGDPKDPYACFQQSRDLPFINAVIKKLEGLYNLDTKRYYLSGHSGGSFFVEGLGLGNSERFAAAAVFSGGCISASDEYGNSCSVYKTLAEKAPRKIPYFVTHGDKDQVVPIKYSVDLLDLVLRPNNFPTSVISKFDGGKYGHSIDYRIVPDVWKWISQYKIP